MVSDIRIDGKRSVFLAFDRTNDPMISPIKVLRKAIETYW